MLDAIQPFFISFMIGLLIGTERERSKAEGTKAVGMRTFILFALLGTLAATIKSPSLTTALALFVFAALLLGYQRATRRSRQSKTIGMTTEIAAATVFLLGYVVLEQRLLAISIATAVLLILYGKRSMHRFARERIKAKEIEAAITLLIIALGIISFLPAQAIDPWQLFYPQNFGIIVLILASLQFSGYIMIRLFGEQFGMMLMGFFGGLISSTAVFASISQASKRKKASASAEVLAGIFATIAKLVALVIVILAASPGLLQYIVWPILAAIALGGASSWLFLRSKDKHELEISYPNPLDLLTILKLALLIMAILLLVGVTRQYLGTQALTLTAFIMGLFDAHAIAYAIAMLYLDQTVPLPQATELLAVVVVSSFISKFALVWMIAHNRFALLVSAYLTAMLIAAGGVYFLLLAHALPQ